MGALLDKRRAGVLLHITSLPGRGECGDLGKEAFNFVNFLHDIGATVWQTLPLGMTHGDGSPYQCLSAHAGNPALINIQWLADKGWLQTTDRCGDCHTNAEYTKSCLVTKAFYGFQSLADAEQQHDFKQFCVEKADWLDDFALFIALRNVFGHKSWNQWPDALKQREPGALNESKQLLKAVIETIKFEQYVFFRQWHELKDYAAKHGVLMFGDIPIFVSYDSADVWANRAVFKLNDLGEMDVVAGVPPDYFSENGQRWGNPHYDWKYLQKTGFKWWLDRIKSQYEMFDILRIDHFRGLEAAWEIPASEHTAINGRWVKAPGAELLAAIQEQFASLSLVAEDLGIITEEVEALRDDFDLPGMKILQFAFGDDSRNPYLPCNYQKNSVVYTGTHDNDTTLGWFEGLNDGEKQRIYDYLGWSSLPMPSALIHAALGSVANLAVIPMQDILKLGSPDRMNTPGTTEGNWRWRFDWSQLTDDKAGHFAHLVRLFGR
ncbi:4-alpha-glucanotransferase [Methylomonas sp. EFPC1]|uniref:4-alpha-glucanotransferase n=1 Tax=unclassified Methylomonas TaxID=2608980 RepID=UPI000C3290F9|nr:MULTISPECIES: 4-alpha-glucanotransferase [unclassified Methylomonas]PKD38348.1 4-alpha-glucanotransferase [Methylomonas sp. Kb3]QSB00527.1 4-alpha-glucanotransferase [Methylomonas sp. EFPC1]